MGSTLLFVLDDVVFIIGKLPLYAETRGGISVHVFERIVFSQEFLVKLRFT